MTSTSKVKPGRLFFKNAISRIVQLKNNPNELVIVFVFIFGLMGASFIIISRASTPTASLEAESSSLSGNASTVSDANASGGQALQFNAPVAPPATSTPARQLGLYVGGFPGSTGNVTKFETDYLGGKKILLAENFQSATWAAISLGNGAYSAWETWLSADTNRRAILSPGMIPDNGPDGSWPTKKGTDDEVSVALQRGANGEFDSYWTQFATSLKPNMKDAYIRLGWEFNGGWYTFRAGPNPTAWVNYWRRIHGIVKANNPNVKFVWNMALSDSQMILRGLGGINLGSIEQAWPGSAYVDVIAVDAYENHSSTRTEQQSWDQYTLKALNYTRDMGIKYDKPIAIGEWGVVDHDGPVYIENMYKWIEDPANKVAWHVYFQTTAVDGDHLLYNFALSGAKFKSLSWRLTP